MPAVDFAELRIEQSPVAENTTPTLASDKLYLIPRSARLAANPRHKDRADEMRSILGAVPKLLDYFEPDGAVTENAYYKDLTWLLTLSGFTPTHTTGGALVADPDTTTATGVNSLNSATVNAGDTSLFPAAGTFILAGTTAVTYTGKTATSFTGCGTHPATVGGETIANNIPTGAEKWVFAKRTGFTPVTAQMILNYADEAVQLKGNGFACSSLSLNMDGDLSGDLMGLVLKRLAVDTTTVPTVTTQAVPPLRRGDLYLSWLAAGGAIQDFSFQIANPLERIRSASVLPPSNYPDLMEFGDEQVRLTGSIPKRILAAADLDALYAASTFSAKARWKSSKVIGATTYAYSMWVEMPAAQLVAGGADDLGNKRRHGSTFDFEAAYDETAGYDLRVTVVNDVAAIATGTTLGF